MRRAGHVARIGAMSGIYRVLVRKPGGKGPLGGQSRRWEDNIKRDLLFENIVNCKVCRNVG